MVETLKSNRTIDVITPSFVKEMQLLYSLNEAYDQDKIEEAKDTNIHLRGKLGPLFGVVQTLSTHSLDNKYRKQNKLERKQRKLQQNQS